LLIEGERTFEHGACVVNAGAIVKPPPPKAETLPQARSLEARPPWLSPKLRHPTPHPTPRSSVAAGSRTMRSDAGAPRGQAALGLAWLDLTSGTLNSLDAVCPDRLPDLDRTLLARSALKADSGVDFTGGAVPRNRQPRSQGTRALKCPPPSVSMPLHSRIRLRRRRSEPRHE
jgi:hypothetical protein